MSFRSLLFLVIIIWSPQALAARLAQVNADEVQVYEKPDSGSEVLQTLPRNQSITTSNLPTFDYYKVRTLGGVIGWVESKFLNFRTPRPPRTLTRHQPPPNPGDDNSAKNLSKTEKSGFVTRVPPEMDAFSSLTPKKGERKSESKASQEAAIPTRFTIHGLVGSTFFSAPGIINNFSNLGPGYSLGGEFYYNLTRQFSIGLRIETLFKNLALTDSGTEKNFLVSLNSLPLMAGLRVKVLENSSISLSLGIFAGVSLSSQLISTDYTDSAPPDPVANVSAQAFTGLAKVEFDWQLNRLFSVMLEGGYRLLRTSTLVAPTNNNGALVLQPSFPIDMSGAMIGGGVGVSF